MFFAVFLEIIIIIIITIIHCYLFVSTPGFRDGFRGAAKQIIYNLLTNKYNSNSVCKSQRICVPIFVCRNKFFSISLYYFIKSIKHFSEKKNNFTLTIFSGRYITMIIQIKTRARIYKYGTMKKKCAILSL